MPSYADLVKKSVLTQPVYEPGRPVEVVAREFGLDPDSVIKLASNENPLGPCPSAVEAARAALDEAHLYPDNSGYFLKQKLSAKLGVAPDEILLGRGSNEILEMLGLAFVEPGVEAVMGEHAFISYKIVTLLNGGIPVEVPLLNYKHDLDAMRAAVTERTRLVFLPSPNNPTGTSNTAEEIEAFAESLPDHVLFVFDGAYEEFVDKPPKLLPLIKNGNKIICLRTFSKIHGLAGLRIGYGYGDAELLDLINRVRAPFNVTMIAQAAAMAALEDDAFIAKSRQVNEQGMRQLSEGFAKMKLDCVQSVGNFILVDVGDGPAAFQALQQRGVITRPLKGYGLPRHLRVTVGLPEENQRLLEALREVL